MYQQTYGGYQQVRTPNHPHPPPQPLHLQTSGAVQPQYHQYSYTASPSMATPRPPQGPPSPSEQSERNSTAEEEFYNLPGPAPTSHIWNGCVWALEVVQHPQRARMCGFGDKDRRPISPPPCIRLIMLDPKTKQEIKYEDVELSHLVLAVDIWDLSASRELNLVKQSSASPCISSAATGAFPTPPGQPPQNHEQPHAYPISQIPNYQSYSHNSPASTSQQSSSTSYYAQGTNPYAAQRQGYSNGNSGHPSPYQNEASSYNHSQYQYNDTRYPPHSGSTFAQHGTQQSAHQQPPPSVGNTPAAESYLAHAQNASQTQLYTRNLIGSLSASAFKLHDENGKLGIWFVLQDLSVRTEGWFRLKLNFFNLSRSVESQIQSIANNGVDGNGGSRTESTAPCLASAFSNPFKVFSAKKFPGVVESTALSRAFATQGIKIPIRKDTQGGTGGGKRGRDGSDDDDNASDMDG